MSQPRWLQLAGWSGVGKTTILKELVSLARARSERVMVLKFSDHAIPSVLHTGDTFRLVQAGAQSAAFWGQDGIVWQGDQTTFFELLTHVEADWILVEGGRMLPTPKILLAQAEWPPASPPVVAGVGEDCRQWPQGLSLKLPQGTDQAASWIDRHRFDCSAAFAIWHPLLTQGATPC